MEAFYKRLREVTTLAELRKIQRDITDAFYEDEITIEQFQALCNAAHNAKILRVVKEG